MNNFTYPHWKRYLRSSVRVFFAAFIPTFFIALQTVTDPTTITWKVIISLAFPAIITGLNAVFKFTDEKKQGII
jgi:hypothetical protein